MERYQVRKKLFFGTAKLFRVDALNICPHFCCHFFCSYCRCTCHRALQRSIIQFSQLLRRQSFFSKYISFFIRDKLCIVLQKICLIAGSTSILLRLTIIPVQCVIRIQNPKLFPSFCVTINGHEGIVLGNLRGLGNTLDLQYQQQIIVAKIIVTTIQHALNEDRHIGISCTCFGFVLLYYWFVFRYISVLFLAGQHSFIHRDAKYTVKKKNHDNI
mmetsp:Transcript_23076/g.37333  ORF Transcript_23076/g.37333 Transcript_23076/m.37333 type:complete len:215 (+) Transcript_23076:1031-1675(+)